TLLTPDGKLVSTFSWEVRNNLKQFLADKLPDGATLWSAYVNGEPVKPVRGQDGELRLSLLRSPSDGSAAFPVEITYVQAGWKPSALGSRQLQAPSVDIPTSQLRWSLFTPDTLALRDFSGTMESGGAPVSFAATPAGQVSLDLKDGAKAEDYV